MPTRSLDYNAIISVSIEILCSRTNLCDCEKGSNLLRCDDVENVNCVKYIADIHIHIKHNKKKLLASGQVMMIFSKGF